MITFEQELAKVNKSLGTSVPKNVTDPETTEEIETTDESPEVGSTGAPVLVTAVTTKNFFQHPDAHPIALDLMLLKKYGADWLSWEPESLPEVISRDFKTTLSEINFHKLNAAKSLHLVDSYWQRWEIFLWCTMAFNGVSPDFGVMQVPTVAQCLVSVDVANRIRDDVAWVDEIKLFLAAVYRHDGIFCPQPPTEFVKLDETGLVDCAEVSRLWPDVRASKKAPEEESITAEQLRRLLIVHGYLEDSREQLKQQLRIVQHA